MASLSARYRRRLAETPIVTKIMTSATIFAFGDLFAQGVDGTLETRGPDFRRMSIASSWALFIFSPAAHLWYSRALPRLFPSVPRQSPTIVRTCTKLFVDQAVFGTATSAGFLSFHSASQEHSFEKITTTLTHQLTPLLHAGWIVWPMIHFAGMKLVPIPHQVIYTNVVLFLWASFLSFAANKVYLTAQKKPINQIAYYTQNTNIYNYTMQLSQQTIKIGTFAKAAISQWSVACVTYLERTRDKLSAWYRCSSETTEPLEKSEKEKKDEKMLRASMLILDALEGQVNEESILLLNELEYESFLPLHQVVMINAAKQKFLDEQIVIKSASDAEPLQYDPHLTTLHSDYNQRLMKLQKNVKKLANAEILCMSDAEIIAQLFDDVQSLEQNDGIANNHEQTEKNNSNAKLPLPTTHHDNRASYNTQSDSENVVNPEITRSFYEAYVPPYNPNKATIMISLDDHEVDMSIPLPVDDHGHGWTAEDEQDLLHLYIKNHQDITMAKKLKKDDPPDILASLTSNDIKNDIFYDEEFYRDVEVGDTYELNVFIPRKHRNYNMSGLDVQDLNIFQHKPEESPLERDVVMNRAKYRQLHDKKMGIK